MEVKTEEILKQLVDNATKIQVLEQRMINTEQAVGEIKALNKDMRDIIDRMANDFANRFGALGWKVAGGVAAMTIIVQGFFKVIGN